MEVTDYEFVLLQLLNSEDIDINLYKDYIIINLYTTLLSLSNKEYSSDIDIMEEEIVRNLLTKLNNLKVKIQLKRKPAEINNLAKEIIDLYYENINILSIYIKDAIELENIITSLDAKSLTNLIDKVTKHKMNKGDKRSERNKQRKAITTAIFTSHFNIKNGIFYLENDNEPIEITAKEFKNIFSYLLNIDNYKNPYSKAISNKLHINIIRTIVEMLMSENISKEDLEKIKIPMILTYLLSSNKNYEDIDTGNFNIENIKINELYSLASSKKESNNTAKWRNISIPNYYLFEKIRDMVQKGMYYFKEDDFVLEKNNDFKLSIKIDKLTEIIKKMLSIKEREPEKAK